jgi:hypothetical protein
MDGSKGKPLDRIKTFLLLYIPAFAGRSKDGCLTNHFTGQTSTGANLTPHKWLHACCHFFGTFAELTPKPNANNKKHLTFIRKKRACAQQKKTIERGNSLRRVIIHRCNKRVVGKVVGECHTEVEIDSPQRD